MVLFIKYGLVMPSLKVYFLGYIYGLCDLLTTYLRLTYDLLTTCLRLYYKALCISRQINYQYYL